MTCPTCGDPIHGGVSDGGPDPELWLTCACGWFWSGRSWPEPLPAPSRPLPELTPEESAALPPF